MVDWKVIQDSLLKWLDVDYILILAGILICYVVAKSFINWVISIQSVKLLTYLVSSMAFLVFFLMVAVITTVLNIKLLVVILQCLAIFGCCLFITHMLQYVFRKKGNKKAGAHG